MTASDGIVTRDQMERWVRDPLATLFGVEQDEDLVMAVPENVPLICEYLDRKDVPMARRAELVLVIADLLGFDSQHGGVTSEVARALRTVLLRNEDAVFASYQGVVGLDAEVMLRRLLGHPIPNGVPEWLLKKYPAVEQADEAAGPAAGAS